VHLSNGRPPHVPVAAVGFRSLFALANDSEGDAPGRDAARSPAKRLNVMFILCIRADDPGPFDPGCYGQQNILTPHLDRTATGCADAATTLKRRCDDAFEHNGLLYRETRRDADETVKNGWDCEVTI